MAELVASQCFLAEVFAPSFDLSGFAEQCDRIMVAAEELTLEGVDVVYVDSLLAPCEETAFHLLQASDKDVAERALGLARVDADRMSIVYSREPRCTALRIERTRGARAGRAHTVLPGVHSQGGEEDA